MATLKLVKQKLSVDKWTSSDFTLDPACCNMSCSPLLLLSLPRVPIFCLILHRLLEWLAKENCLKVRQPQVFFVLLREKGNKAFLDWVMKEGLISSRYEYSKCKKGMRLVERKGTIDGFEWRCRVQSKENPHLVCRSELKLSGATAQEDQGLLCPCQYTRPLGAEVHEQMSRSGGQSEARPPSVSLHSSLVLIYQPTVVEIRLSGFQLLNDDEIETSVQAKSDPVDDEMDEDEDNNNESNKDTSNAGTFSALETAMEWYEQQSECYPTQLLLLKRIRDFAAKTRKCTMLQRKISDYFPQYSVSFPILHGSHSMFGYPLGIYWSPKIEPISSRLLLQLDST
ncbi:uncharacterized protein TNCV_1670581 [Trichonephila clavipes]|nr:uncharacterized protein TNCV_1670581 [Trichonephila clavipes]